MRTLNNLSDNNSRNKQKKVEETWVYTYNKYILVSYLDRVNKR